jgi:hypothetical protein
MVRTPYALQRAQSLTEMLGEINVKPTAGSDDYYLRLAHHQQQQKEDNE